MEENQNDKDSAESRMRSSSETSFQKTTPVPKKHSTASNVLYLLLVLGLALAVWSYIFSHRTPKDALYLPLWIGILTGWTAKRNGRRGWLWFLIGFLGIGFAFVIIVSVIQAYFDSLT